MPKWNFFPLPRATFGLIIFCLAGFIATLASAADPPGQKERPYHVKVTHVCIITPQFANMQKFYQRLLRLEPKQFQEDYVEFQTPGAIVSLYEEASFVRNVPAYKPPSGPGGMMLELQVADVDQEFRRLHTLGFNKNIILPPTTFPWGNRSIYLRDPDGNLINLYSLVPSPSSQ